MKTLHFHSSYALSILIATLVMITGCASTGADLVDRGEVKLELVHSDYARFHRVSVRQEEGVLNVSGYLYKRFHHKRLDRTGFVWGHVNIEVVSSDGDILQQRSTRFTRVGLSKSGKFKFSVRLPGTIPQGGSISVVHRPDNLQLKPSVFLHPAPGA